MLMLMLDGYKLGHPRQYPHGTQRIYSNSTARASRVPGVDRVVFFGLQYFLQHYLIDAAEETFFDRPLYEVLNEWDTRVNAYLGPNNRVGNQHIADLWELGYLPLEFWAVPEGTRVPLRMPHFTVENTLDDFYWLTNSFETLLQNTLWLPQTSATTSWQYRQLLNRHTTAQGASPEFTPFQAHDFSMRGMTSLESAMLSGAAHLLSFVGTDTVPALDLIENFYGGYDPDAMIGVSVPATEHSVMCAGGQTNEYETYDRLITEVEPDGIISVVSDQWDYWKVLTEIVPSLKEKIMHRPDGKVVIRPDSGDPVKIVCGDPDAPVGSPEFKGTVQLLWETFGGTTTEKGFRTLDSHIGVIYGDSITLERCDRICTGLGDKGFSVDNIVFGIGSYTFQYVTRDTYSIAMKATWARINGEEHQLSKDPKTDYVNGVSTKKSAKGRISLNRDVHGDIQMYDGLDYAEWELLVNDPSAVYRKVWVDGDFTNNGRMNFEEVRRTLWPQAA